MNAAGLMAACRHHHITRDAEISPTGDRGSAEIVKDDMVEFSFLAAQLECGPDARYPLAVLSRKDMLGDIADASLFCL